MQSAINMHLSQISHGKLGVYNSDLEGQEAMFLPTEDNEVVVGYSPSMIRLLVMDSAGLLLVVGCWYDWMPEYIWFGGSIGPSLDVIATNERGFVLDGGELVALNSDAAMVIWETVGCKNNNDYRTPMNPGPAVADNHMDRIAGWQPCTDYGDEGDESS